MKKQMILLIVTVILAFSCAAASAQTAEEAESSLQLRFPTLSIREKYNQYEKPAFYRFSPDTLFFEPLDLSYFPHEKWNKEEWALLRRWTDKNTYNQIIYLDKPAKRQIMHGTATGETRGYLRDFYLYITLFIEDNYPQNTGSCYVYFSDSLMIGFKESKGILIDPGSGIYEATNSYGGSRHATYTPGTIKHSLELIQELDPADYEITPEDAETSSIGAAVMTKEKLDEQFLQDWDNINNTFRMKAGSPVKAYRIEVIRQDGIDEIYINGKKAASINDPIKTINKNDEIVPEKVSWSYGPILNEGGLTVTCAAGDFYIYSTGQREN